MVQDRGTVQGIEVIQTRRRRLENSCQRTQVGRIYGHTFDVGENGEIFDDDGLDG